MSTLVAVFLGGGLGACSRYLLSHAVSQQFYFSKIPLGTLAANAIGSLLIGFFFQMFQSIAVPSYVRVAVAVGFIGAFTTFSTYILEILQLGLKRQYLSAVYTFILQNVLGFAMVITGILLAGKLLQQIKGA